MSTPNLRRPARGTSSPSTPTKSLSSYPSDNSVSIEPKSEYLRHALDARRAKQAAPTPAPAESTPPQSAKVSQQGSDPWLDQAEVERDVAKVALKRRNRRPSEGAHPRVLTQREQHAEAERVKEVLFGLNLKLELIRKQNNELKDQMDEANKRIAELEHLEEENYDLREHSQKLELKMHDVIDEVVELRERNQEILQIQDESVANMEKQNAALEEAAEIILRMEKEKDVLAQENILLRETHATPTAETYHAGLDGHSKHPVRVYSVDESRPSTSHYGSDYYSQPGSPHVKASKESLPSITVSDRARTFLSLNRESRKSVQDLKKRFSDASMKQVRLSSVSIPEVPQIPESHQERRKTPTPTPPRAPTPQSAARTPRRAEPKVQASSTLAPSTPRATPRTPTEGLRGLFQNNLSLDTSSARNPRPSSSYGRSPLESKNYRSSRDSDRPAEIFERGPIPQKTVLPRHSSRQAQTSTSDEALQQHHHDLHSPQPQRDSGTWSDDAQTQADASEWDKFTPSESVVSELYTEPEADYRARWFMTVDKLNNRNNDSTTTIGHAYIHPSAATVGSRIAASTPSRSSRMPMLEQNFLFNPTEDDEQFMEKVRGVRRGG